MSDSIGTIATYTHAFWNRLTSVTYADGSKYIFTDVFSGNNVYLTTVKDALNNVLESHAYDSQGRALTSEIAGNGTERYTLTYVSATETHVTDALNRVTKYFFDTSKGRNVLPESRAIAAAAVRRSPNGVMMTILTSPQKLTRSITPPPTRTTLTATG